eukprot:TRINITY_DN461_c0_g1_i3.p1 TRINITY_DN461_c0_g1~~TRINITY_DN461_c0_g1_i3.p1  ORF type:complete len:824 (-),score=278.71 TRINITY_DN461_c0_g1_i3:147-2618(-)
MDKKIEIIKSSEEILGHTKVVYNECAEIFDNMEVSIRMMRKTSEELASTQSQVKQQISLLSKVEKRLIARTGRNEKVIESFEGRFTTKVDMRAVFQKLKQRTLSNNTSKTLFSFVDEQAVENLERKGENILQDMNAIIKVRQEFAESISDAIGDFQETHLENIKTCAQVREQKDPEKIVMMHGWLIEALVHQRRGLASYQKMYKAVMEHVAMHEGLRTNVYNEQQLLLKERDIHEGKNPFEGDISERSITTESVDFSKNYERIQFLTSKVDTYYKRVQKVNFCFNELLKKSIAQRKRMSDLCIQMDNYSPRVREKIVDLETMQTRFNEMNDEAKTVFGELEHLVEFYTKFMVAYEHVGNELRRRWEYSRNMQKKVERVQKEFDEELEKENSLRRDFFENYARFLPSALCPKVCKEPPIQYTVIPPSTEIVNDLAIALTDLNLSVRAPTPVPSQQEVVSKDIIPSDNIPIIDMEEKRGNMNDVSVGSVHEEIEQQEEQQEDDDNNKEELQQNEHKDIEEAVVEVTQEEEEEEEDAIGISLMDDEAVIRSEMTSVHASLARSEQQVLELQLKLKQMEELHTNKKDSNETIVEMNDTLKNKEKREEEEKDINPPELLKNSVNESKAEDNNDNCNNSNNINNNDISKLTNDGLPLVVLETHPSKEVVETSQLPKNDFQLPVVSGNVDVVIQQEEVSNVDDDLIKQTSNDINIISSEGLMQQSSNLSSLSITDNNNNNNNSISAAHSVEHPHDGPFVEEALDIHELLKSQQQIILEQQQKIRELNGSTAASQDSGKMGSFQVVSGSLDEMGKDSKGDIQAESVNEGME